jgi:hypothetical protein
MEKSPQIIIDVKLPRIGIIVRRFVITVAAHRDIWPQGNV